MNSNVPTPLLTTIKKIESQMTLLTQPRHLDGISRRLKLLNTEIERTYENKNKLNDDDNEKSVTNNNIYNKVEYLFNLLERVEDLIPITPLLLNRLKTLSDLHQNSSEVFNDLQNLKKLNNNFNNELNLLQNGLNTLDKTLNENSTTTNNNVKLILSRIDSLTQRLNNL